MKQADFKRAEKMAEELLKKYSIEDPVTPVFDIAESEGLKVKVIKMPENLKDLSGFIDPDKGVIYVNADDSSKRQLFTVAHELGHYALKHEPNDYGVLPRNTTEPTTPAEKEANCFAANILVPSVQLKRFMKQYRVRKGALSSLDVELLADIFGVSNQMMRHRLNKI